MTMDTLPSQALPDIDDTWNYADPAGTEVVFRELLSRPAVEAEGAYRLELLTQLARTQSLQRKWPECHAILDEVEPHAAEAPPRVRVRLWLERGRAFNDVGRYAEAKCCFRQAWELGLAEGLDFLAVDAAHMFGIMEPAEEAIAWNETALAHARASKEPRARRWVGSVSNNLGWAYHQLDRFDEALVLFRDLVTLHAEAGRPKHAHIARYSVAKTLRRLGRLDEALAEIQAMDAEQSQADGYVEEERAECLLALGRPADARPHFAQAYELLSKDPWFPPGETDRLNRLGRLGQGLAG